MPNAPEIIHGTAIALENQAVLIRGPSGSGKSDLALRCLSLPASALTARAEFVGDDYLCVGKSGTKILLSAPDAIRNKLEVRGIGIVTVQSISSACLRLVADLVTPDEIERLPDHQSTTPVCGMQIPVVKIAPFETSAPVKLLIALKQAGQENVASSGGV